MGSTMFNGVLIAAFSVFFISGMAFSKTKQVNVVYPAQVGSSLHLRPGNYRIDLVNNTASPEVKFYNQYGKLVGMAPVKVVSELQKNSQTEVDYSKLASNKEALTEISPSGWAEKLIFVHTHQNSAMDR